MNLTEQTTTNRYDHIHSAIVAEKRKKCAGEIFCIEDLNPSDPTMKPRYIKNSNALAHVERLK